MMQPLDVVALVALCKKNEHWVGLNGRRLAAMELLCWDGKLGGALWTISRELPAA